MATTITYDELNKGWTSFHSYEPEWMDRLGNNFYSFKNGNIYLHDSNSTRTNFYGTNYGCNVTVSVNKEPSTVKVFKTIGLESNSSIWSAVLNSEQESGVIYTGKFVDKEGIKYGYIRRGSADFLNFNELSIIGLGNLQATLGSNQFEFTSNIPNQITANNVNNGTGDKLYFNNGSTLELGVISNINANVITVYSIANAPAVGNFCFVTKNSDSESFGLRGYHSTIKLTNQSTSFVELYSVNSEVMKSYM
jgi:hypothetical protein